jgi:peptidoglycan hydrolase FlgJ
MTPGTNGIGGATGIASGLDRSQTKESLAKAGQQFEAVFTGMMMKAMRQATLAEPLFDSQAIDTFRDMQDQKVVQAMAEHSPMGIGKAMTEFLARALPQDEATKPNVNQGGGTAAE